jgi:hypothetical protein
MRWGPGNGWFLTPAANTNHYFVIIFCFHYLTTNPVISGSYKINSEYNTFRLTKRKNRMKGRWG